MSSCTDLITFHLRSSLKYRWICRHLYSMLYVTSFIKNPSDGAESYDCSVLVLFLWRKPHTDFHIWWVNLHSHTLRVCVLFPPFLCQYLLLFWWFSFLHGWLIFWCRFEQFLVNVTCGNSYLPTCCLWSQLSYCMPFDWHNMRHLDNIKEVII